MSSSRGLQERGNEEQGPPGTGASSSRYPQEHPAPGAPGNESAQQQRSPGARASSSRSLREQELPATETNGSKSFQQQEHPGEKERGDERSGLGTRGDDRKKRSHYRDTMAVRAAVLGCGAAGGLLLLARWDSLLLALLLGSFLTWSWLIDWCRGATCTSRASLQGKLALATETNTGIRKETARGLADRGARVVLACRDFKRERRRPRT